jgi:hypothetical protein
VEGDRIRLGARTYFGLNDPWRVQFYTAYGFKDQQVKYGVEARYMFNRLNRFMIGAGTSRDIVQLGGQLTSGDGVTPVLYLPVLFCKRRKYFFKFCKSNQCFCSY